MGKAKTDEITPLQRKTLEAICRFVDAKGFPPTMKELSEIFEISPASAHDRINQLVRKGYLKREDGKSRGIAVARRPSEMAASLVSIPVVGMVAVLCKRTSFPAWTYWMPCPSYAERVASGEWLRP